MRPIVLFAFFLLPHLWICAQDQTDKLDTQLLVGSWELDMTPQDQTDNNFAMMEISKVDDNSFKGEFYRKGVPITNANINTQTGVIYGALVSGDGSGTYHTTFYAKDGILYGTTHALERNFLAVWTGRKLQ
ncbi:MAG: hypothetical protein Tsb004_28270 [Allomuricauda sp.]